MEQGVLIKPIRITNDDEAKTYFWQSAWAHGPTSKRHSAQGICGTGQTQFDNQGNDSSSWMGEKYQPAGHLVNRPLEPVRRALGNRSIYASRSK
jgi:hypothetical protein